MALIKCPHCKRAVSEYDETCRHCNAPIRQPSATAQPTIAPDNVMPRVVTVEATSKRIKGHMLASVALVCIGVVVMIAGQPLGAIMSFVGLIYFLVTRFRAWWHHG